MWSTKLRSVEKEREAFGMLRMEKGRLQLRLLLCAVVIVTFYLLSGIKAEAVGGGDRTAVEVVQKDGTTFSSRTLDLAWTQIQDGCTIFLKKNVTSTKQLTVPEGMSITIDLRGHDIIRSSGAGIFKVQGELTLTDSTVEAGIADTRYYYIDEDHLGHVGTSEDQSLTTGRFKGGCISGGGGSSVGGSVFVDGGKFTMKAGAIIGSVAEGEDEGFVQAGDPDAGGGAVYVLSGEFVMDGGFLVGNKEMAKKANSGGGAVCVNSGAFTMNGGEIVHNNSTHSGGAVRSNGSVVVNDGLISHNCVPYSSGAFYIGAMGNAIVNGGEISYNVADKSGGAFGSLGSITINNGRITGNQASYGAVMNVQNVNGSVKLFLNGGNITGNRDTLEHAFNLIHGIEIHLSGSPVVKDNLTGDAQQNIRMTPYHCEKIVIDGPLNKDAKLAFILADFDLSDGQPFTLTEGWNTYMKGCDPADYFLSDQDGYKFVLDPGTGEVVLLDTNLSYRTVKFTSKTSKTPVSAYILDTREEKISMPEATIKGWKLNGWRVNGTGDLIGVGEEYTFTDDQDVTFVADLTEVHQWEYSVSEAGNEIVATCANGKKCELGGKATLSIEAPAKTVYDDGKSPAAKLSGVDEFNEKTGLTVSDADIVYKKGKTVLKEGPTEVGTYTASIKVGKVTATVEYKIGYCSEWIDGWYYHKNGEQIYQYKADWVKDAKGWKYVDEAGAFPKGKWQKIDKKWYYFDQKGYMESCCYRDGWYLQKDGSWDGRKAVKGWKKTASGWQYIDGTALNSGWMKINGNWCYFFKDGRAAEGEFVKGYWFKPGSCAWDEGKVASWHKTGNRWWYGYDGWYAKSRSYTIDGKSYKFDAKGLLVE